MSCCIDRATPLQQIDMNVPLGPALVTPPPSPRPMREEEYTCSTQQRRKRKAPGAVHFRNFVEIYAAPSPLDAVMNEDSTGAWKDDLWYSSRELSQFRNQAREMCRKMRTESAPAAADAPASAAAAAGLTICSNPQTRGLEQRSCLERQRRRYIGTRFIVQTASKLRARKPSKKNKSISPEEHLAVLAQKCNSWATVLAIEEAARDYLRAYFGNDDIEVDENKESAAALPQASLKRRLSSQCDALERATLPVRARLA